MKTSSVRQCSMAVAVGLAFFLGCARPSAQTEQQKAIVSTAIPSVAVAAQAAPGAPDPTAPKPDADTNAPAILERIPPSTRPEAVATTSGISEVAKLAQAGVNEQVMLAFVEKYNGRFDVGADQIVYLNDLGVSSTVITAMLKHDDAKAPGVVAEAPPQEVSTAPTRPANPPAITSTAPPPTSSTEVSYFYDSLSPYGSWIYLSGYGWCWQPTVAVSVPTWRPYCDNGGWYWSNSGWYWNSDYSWGWAAFHYGRWYYHGRCGWVWTPGTVWGPSWVSWRYQNGYCGWAPLPPTAHYVSGVGFTYYGSHVSVGFEFGLTAFHYSFVHANHFCDPAPYHHLVARPAVANIYHNTTVINNYGSGSKNTVINNGIGKDTIARSGGGTRVREVTVRETPLSNFAGGRNQKPERQGNQLVAYRPQLPQTPPTVRTAPNAGRGHLGDTTGGRGTGGGGGRVTPDATPRSQPGVGSRDNSEVARRNPGNGLTPSTPNIGGQQNAPRNNERVTTLTPGRALPPQSVTRRDDSLFGNSGAERTQPRNNTPTVQTPPHTVPQKFPPSVTGIPRNPNPPLATTHQGTPRAEQQNNAPQTRVAPNNPYQSPRQYEQAPRRVETAPAANPAPQYSRPAPNSSPSQGQPAPTSGGSSGNSGSGRGVRNH